MFFVAKNGKAVAQKIETGIRTDTKVQICQGVNIGDTIITSGIIQMRPGASVNVKIM